MGSTFGSYGTAVSGMQSSQAGLGVIGHNMANANSVGFSRQQAMIKDSYYSTVGNQHIGYQTQKLQVGLGSDVSQIRQIRNTFLDIAYRQENTKLGYYGSLQKHIGEIESIANDTQDTGFQAVFNEFYNALNEVQKDPTSLAARGLLKNRSMELCQTVNYIYSQLEVKQTAINDEIKSKINTVNQLANQVSSLNETIMKAEAAGDKANDLRDTRNNVLDQLSKLIDCQISENERGQTTILFGEGTLVNGTTVNPLVAATTTDTEGGTAKGGGYVYPAWASNPNVPIDVEKGEIAALIETRGGKGANGYVTGSSDQWKNGALEVDGSGNVLPIQKDLSEYGIIPAIKRQLNTLMNKFATDVNAVVQGCKDLKGNAGAALFASSDGGVITAGNLMFNSAQITDLDRIAVSKSGVNGDGDGAFDIINLRRDASAITFDKDGKTYQFTYDDFYNDIVTSVGNKGQQVNGAMGAQKDLMTQLDNQRQSISGVSLDEEMQNMLVFQHAYSASARVFNSIDEMVKTVINDLVR